MQLPYFVRGATQRKLLGMRLRWRYVLGALGLVYGAISLLLDAPGTRLSTAIAFLLTAFGVASFLAETLAIRRARRNLHFLTVDPARLRELRFTDTYVGWERFHLRDLTAIYSTAVNDALPDALNPIGFSPTSYRLPEEVARAPIRTFIIHKKSTGPAVLFDSAKLRLATDITPAVLTDARPVTVQKTTYFNSLCTNEITSRSLVTTADEPVVSGPDLAANNGYLADLEHSKCSNHIGISTLAFTSDGHLLITVQAGSSGQSESLLAPSSSGSADLADMRPRGDTLGSFLARGMERELAEECGIETEQLSAPLRTRPIGFARLLMRGGKPEFFGLTYVSAASANLGNVPWKERHFIAEVRAQRINRSQPEELAESLRQYRNAAENRLSLPLALHLLFAIRFIETQPDAFRSLIDPA